MKQLVCEMCGSTDLVKDGGVFVCQSCGCKYSVEEAKKMMVEGTVNVQGTVKVDNTAQIENFLGIAKNALSANNHSEADDYANKILEIDPQHAEAWLIKGEAVGWQTTDTNDRLQESVNAWVNAIKYVGDEQLEDFRNDIAKKSGTLYMAVVDLHAGNFERVYNDDYCASLIATVRSCVDYMNQLSTKAGIRINRGLLYSMFADKMGTAAVNGFTPALKRYANTCNDFSPENFNMAKREWNRFTASCDLCIKVLKEALDYARSESTKKGIYDGLISIGEAAKDSRFLSFDTNDLRVKNYSFTAEEKSARQEDIDRWRKFKDAIADNRTNEILKGVRGDKDKQELDLGRKKYWEEHASEKSSLEQEKASAKSRIEQIKVEKDTLPVLASIEEAKADLKNKESELSSLGLFKGKEKAALRDKIEGIKGSIKDLEAQAESAKKQLDDEAAKLEERIVEIDYEFTKDRGRVSLDDDVKLAMDNPVVDGSIAVSAKALAAHLDSILPGAYSAKIWLEDPESPTFEMNLGDACEIQIWKEDEEVEDTADIRLYSYPADGDAPISALMLEKSYGDPFKDDLTDWVVVGSHLLCSLDGEISKSWAEELFCDLLVGEDKPSLGATEDLSVEYVHCQEITSLVFGYESKSNVHCAVIRKRTTRGALD